jgi:ATP-dependent Clp protease ATP-binding subunit ClpC
MVRLDMSEFKANRSEDRIIGSTESGEQAMTLATQVRKQPFSVVLLDEFEKAHPDIWDLFLQVFDDGRLTDRYGNTADFRHAIIILTSNLGSTIHPGISIGFDSKTAEFSSESVEKTIMTTFRREFINRIDRLVVFRPLDRSVMRKILRKELDASLQRRGLRTREWAVEWEDSAVDFLLEKGFTRDLGARPLKRAIERYLLSPLAMTIVNHQFPKGDQFLFVRSDGTELNVEFVDPDAPEPDETIPASETSESLSEAEGLQVKQLIVFAKGNSAEVRVLRDSFLSLESKIGSTDWAEKKQEALGKISSEEFWNSNDCHKVLGEIEFMDRMESGFETAESLLNRLIGNKDRARTALPRQMTRRLAQQLYLLQEAYRSYAGGLPKDAFLMIESSPKQQESGNIGKDFGRRLRAMYQAWGRQRRMNVRLLEEHDGGDFEPFRCILAVSGFGSYAILEPEAGLHIWEIPRGPKKMDRYNARVVVTGQPQKPEQTIEALLEQARKSLDQIREVSTIVVRHYRPEPSPLVRDNVKKWRTGNIDRVLNGDFDLLG